MWRRRFHLRLCEATTIHTETTRRYMLWLVSRDAGRNKQHYSRVRFNYIRQFINIKCWQCNRSRWPEQSPWHADEGEWRLPRARERWSWRNASNSASGRTFIGIATWRKNSFEMHIQTFREFVFLVFCLFFFFMYLRERSNERRVTKEPARQRETHRRMRDSYCVQFGLFKVQESNLAHRTLILGRRGSR